MQSCESRELITTITIPGRAYTKKNHSRIIHSGKKHVLLPSKQYQQYEADCKPHILQQWNSPPINYGISVEMLVVLPNYSGVGDHAGYIQSLGDILQKWGVVADDKWISWNSPQSHHWLQIDKQNPRVELIMRRYPHPSEFRN